MEASKKDHATPVSDALLQVVSFQLGREVFAIDILQVQEIIRMMEITQVPEAPVHVEGIINLRGKVIPVVDLRKRFNLPVKEEDQEERIIVLKRENNPVGMIVDAVSEVLRFPRETVEPAPSMVSNIDSKSIAGVAKVEDRILILLDMEKLFSDTEQINL